MRMRNKILNAYPEADFVCSSAERIYVADFSERTKAVRKVEVHEQVPNCPLKPDKEMDCFVLDNKNTLSIDFHIFAEHIHFFAVNEIVVNDKSVLSTSKE